jgi:prevent-host-death family protein
MQRKIIGIREAKNRFSALVHDAQRGDEWVIAQRGKAVAKIVPMESQALTLQERVARLEAAGLLEPAPVETRGLPPPLPLPPAVSILRILDEDRGAW